MQNISLANLAITFIPVAAVLAIFYRWSLAIHHSLIALARMLLQLILIGYCLVYIFESNNQWLVIGILLIMIMAASWIALRTIENKRRELLAHTVIAVCVGGGSTLAIIVFGVLELDPWYAPQYTVPLAGMTFACSMNSVSLAAERYFSELKYPQQAAYEKIRNTAMQTAMIPVINSLLAVGIVHLPGMMTGQILSGVSPLIAVRYQIMVLCMLFSASGISAACFLALAKTHYDAASLNTVSQQPTT